MQRYNATVRLGGKLDNTVIKKGISASEIMVLQHIHGEDAVVDIKDTGEMDMVPYKQEYEHLSKVYRAKNVVAVFPGRNPNMPSKLSDVDIDVEQPFDQEVSPRGPEFEKNMAPKQGDFGGEESEDTFDLGLNSPVAASVAG